METPPANSAAPVSAGRFSRLKSLLQASGILSARLGAWNYYFLAKFLLFWRELIGLHPIENLVFLLLLLAPVSAVQLRRFRNFLSVPVAAALLYYDSWLPPIARAFSQAGLLSNFSANYMIELGGRFISWPVVAMLAVTWLLYFFIARYLRIDLLVAAVLVAIAVFHAPQSPSVTAGGEAASATDAGTSKAVKSLDESLQEFYQKEAQRSVVFSKPAEGSIPFDVIFIHVCSLSWDDLQATGLEQHPLWKNFDLILRRFNSASSYSGPAAIRVLRANCGLTSHRALYSPTPDGCYLMPGLRKAGFGINLVLNHDGHFDDFLSFVQNQGLPYAPMPLTGISSPLRSFDESPIYDDRAVLSRWMETRQKDNAPRIATYYNTISLHDGNLLVADPRKKSQDTFKLRLTKLLDDLDGFMRQMERSGRRAVVVLVPEHGAAFRGDVMQIAGLREIASPAITLVPVGLKVIGPDMRRIGESLQIKDATSYLAISHIISRMLVKPPYGAGGFRPADYTNELPLTDFVSENEGATILQRGDKYFLHLEKEAWKEYTVSQAP